MCNFFAKNQYDFMKKTISHPTLTSLLEKYFYGYLSEDTSELFTELSQREISEELIEAAAIGILRYAEVIQMITNYSSSKVELLSYGMFIFYDIRITRELNDSVIEILKQKESKYLLGNSTSKRTLLPGYTNYPRTFLTKLNEFFTID
jgi:hypothetical protein